jgi:hypothetical protein
LILDWTSIPLPAITFILGFIASQFFLSKTDKVKIEQEYYKNSVEIKNKHDPLFKEYTEALKAYITVKNKPSFENFFQITVAGDRYFGSINSIADAILSKKLDKQMVQSTFVPAVCKAVKDNLANHYDTLNEIAAKNGFEYKGELDRSRFQSAFSILEKYGHLTGEPGSKLSADLSV